MLCDRKKRRNFHSAYLVAEHLTVADIVMFSHFWKLMCNPECDKDLCAKMKECCMKFPEIECWLK